MADFDPSTATIETPPAAGGGSGTFDPNSASLSAPPSAPGSALGQIGAGLARGALVDLPTVAGQALKFASSPGNAVYNAGQAAQQFGENLGQKSWLTLNPDQHGSVVNALAQGAEQIAPVAAVPLAIGAGAAALGASPLIAGGAALAGTGALFAGQAGQSTLEKAQAKGVSPDDAQTASRLNAATTFATQVGLGMVGGKFLGIAGNALGKVVGSDAAPLAGQILDQMTGQGAGALAQTARALPGALVEGVGLGAGQAAASAAIEQHYGVDNTDPLQAAKDAIVPMLGLTAALTPLGLAGRALQIRAARNTAQALGSHETAPELRSSIADQYAAQLHAGGAPEEAQAFRTNAQTAIDNNLPIDVSGSMFQNGAINVPRPVSEDSSGQGEMFEQPLAGPVAAPEAAPAEATPTAAPGQGTLDLGPQLALANNPSPIPLGQDAAGLRTYTFPGGSSTNDFNQVQSYLDALPAEQRAGARAQIFGFEPQATTYDAATEPRQAAVDAMKQVAAAPEPNLSAQDAINTITGVDRSGLSKQDIAKRRADATAALNEPSGVRVADADTGIERQLTMGELYDLRNKPAETPAAPEAPVDPLAARPAATITQDALDASTAAGFDLKKQSTAPLQKRLDALNLDQLPTHQAQIDALDAAVADTKNGISQGVRDRMDALAQKWKAEQPPAISADTAPADLPTMKNGDSIPFKTKTGDQITISKQPGLDADAMAPGHVPGEQDEAIFTAHDASGKEIGSVRFTPGSKAIESEVDPTYRRQGIGTALYDLAEKHGAVLEDGESLGTVSPDALALRAARDRRGTAITEPPPNNDLGSNIPTPAPDNAPPPPQAEALGRNIDQLPTERAASLVPQLDATLADFKQRVAAGEKLKPLEQERYQDAQSLRDTLGQITGPRGGNYADDYIHDINDFAEQALSPYSKSFRDGSRNKVGSPEDVDPGLLVASAFTGKLNDTLGHLAENGSTPWVKDIASKLNKLGLDTNLQMAREPRPDNPDASGEFRPMTNSAVIYPGGETEHTILHEAVHAATESRLLAAEQMGTPRNQADAQLKSAYSDLESVRDAALKAQGSQDQYGLTDAHEFIAELHSNPDFQQFLKDNGGQKSLWSRAIDSVRKLLGMSVDDRNGLQKALEASQPFFSNERVGQDQLERFNKSPAGASDVTDKVMAGIAKLGDRVPLDFASANRALFQKTLGWKTVQFIADRVRAVPEMVRSGFAKGVDDYQAAHQARTLASARVDGENGKFAQGVQRMLNGLGDSAKARDLSRQLATIGGEASRGGFDYRMNFADNKKARPDLPDANKAYIDDMHRQYTQLKSTNPEAAKALEDGEKLSRKSLITQTSTVVRNLMDAVGDSNARSGAADPTHMLESALAGVHHSKLDFMDKTLDTAKNSRPGHFYDGATSALAARLEDAFSAARKLPDGSVLRDHMQELESLYRAQVDSPYFSLGRSGDYFVKVGFKNMDAATQARLQGALKGTNKVLGNLLGGEDHAFFRVDTADQAKGLRAKLEAAGADKVDRSQSADGKLADKDFVNSAGVTPALRALMGTLHESIDANPALKGDQAQIAKEAINRQLLSMLPETSSRSAKMQRRGIPGYDADFLGNYARRASGAVQDTSNLYSAPLFAAAAKSRSDAIQGLNRTGSQDAKVRAQMVDDEINRRYGDSMKHVDNTAVNTINSLGHTFYLAASPAYLIRTTAQPFHRALPILGSRYGFVNSAKEIGKATGTAYKVMANTIRDGAQADGFRGVLDANTSFKNMGLTKPEEDFVQELHDRGILNLGQARQLQAMSLGGTQRQQDLTRMASMTAQYAEMTNRLATGLAAFRLAEKGTSGVAQEGHAANTEYAIQAIDRAMDNFDPSNTARQIGKQGFAGKVTPLLTAFMNYNLQTMQQIARTVHDGLFNKDQSPAGLQRSAEAKKEFAGLMATTTMISGAMGLPFANAFAGVYNMLTSDKDQPGDIRIDAQNFLADTFGKTVGDAISHGVPRLAGLDSSTFGLENLLPGSDFLSSRELLKDRIESQSQQLVGPALNAGIDLAVGMDKISQGYFAKGVEQMLPSGLKPYYKAAELATKGYTDSKGNPIGLEATPWDVAQQAVGFQSAKKATQSEAQQYLSTNQAILAQRRSNITDQIYKGVTSGDPEAIRNAVVAMTDFNAKNPFEPIRSVQSAVRTRLQELAVSEASGTGVPTPVHQLPLLNKVRFARDDEAAAAMPRN